MSADNQQEMTQLFYYTGFCSGELSCSLIKATNPIGKEGSVRYYPDITFSNADKDLLFEVNKVIGNNQGVLSPIKGGYNLKFRGKRKVQLILEFFEKYPPIVGDLTTSKLTLLHESLIILRQRTTRQRSNADQQKLEAIRANLVLLKRNAIPYKRYNQIVNEKNCIGYFLSGVLDAEGSVGIKSNGSTGQPFFAVAMKDKKIIELFHSFLNMGNIHFRSNDGLYHFEIGAKNEVLKALSLFINRYPSRLSKMKTRIAKLHQILNDYTPGSRFNWEMI